MLDASLQEAGRQFLAPGLPPKHAQGPLSYSQFTCRSGHRAHLETEGLSHSLMRGKPRTSSADKIWSMELLGSPTIRNRSSGRLGIRKQRLLGLLAPEGQVLSRASSWAYMYPSSGHDHARNWLAGWLGLLPGRARAQQRSAKAHQLVGGAVRVAHAVAVEAARDVVELHADLRAPARERLARLEQEGHAVPARVVDEQRDRRERGAQAAQRGVLGFGRVRRARNLGRREGLPCCIHAAPAAYCHHSLFRAQAALKATPPANIGRDILNRSYMLTAPVRSCSR